MWVIESRATGKVSAKVVDDTDSETLQGFVTDRTQEGAQVYTDDASAYRGIARPHEAVRHSAGEYVRHMAHTNGIESFWSMLKRAHKGTYHKMSAKHLDRYVAEFSRRHNIRETGTLDQMGEIFAGMIGQRLMYQELIADNGMDSGARS